MSFTVGKLGASALGSSDIDEINQTGREQGNCGETDGLKEGREPPICQIVGSTKAVNVESEWHSAEDQQATKESKKTNPHWRLGTVGTSEGSDENEDAAADFD